MDALTVLNIVAVSVLAVYALHQGTLLLIYLVLKWRARSAPAARLSHADVRSGVRILPRVTIQLPLYNERYVAERIIASASALDYPRELLQIQVLDDSTDDTSRIAAHAVQTFADRGLDIVLIHRDSREGYKAGALANGLHTASGELIAIFDADFIPPRDFLQRVIRQAAVFDDPRVGFVQTRWGHINRDASILTAAQAVLLDMSFVIDQSVRSHLGLKMNFNGSGGIWRRVAIDSAGGWQSDTLTEDLDLSYRAQIKGWRGRYLADVVCPGELPDTVLAFKLQQARWTRGSVQCVRKLFPIIARSDMPLWHKLTAYVHISGYFSNLAVLLLALITPLMLLDASSLGHLPGWFGALSTIGMLPVLAMLVAQWSQGRALPFLRVIPAAIILGVGMSLSDSLAVIAGLLGATSGEFIRTPKLVSPADVHPVSVKSDTDIRKTPALPVYLLQTDWTVRAEMLLGIYALAICLLVAIRGAGLSALPALLYAGSFLGVALGQIMPALRLQRGDRARRARIKSRLPSLK
ncbi:MAG: glycosyltransferase [Chloroflexi bacterium]|nr:glycosyltransferase [Chloroflexota bacterium]MCL5275653.1 glycosyltransferase [Chloroflexota bacterium]